MRRGDGPAVDAALITHAHLDHNGDLSYLEPAIPVYATGITTLIARTMQLTGQSGFEREITYVNPRCWNHDAQALKSDPQAPCRTRRYALLAGSVQDEIQSYWRQIPHGKKALEVDPLGLCAGCIAGLEVRWWPVDHSVPGAAAVAVRTSGGWIGYTGDLRFHGRHGSATECLAEELARLELAALICEATNPGDRPPITEQQVAANALALVRESKGRLVVADFAPRNVERLITFLDVAREAGRSLVVQPKDAYLLQAIALADPVTFPNPLTVNDLVVYADPKCAPRGWEVTLRQEWASRTVTPAQVSATPGDYVLCFGLWDAADLLDLQGIAGGIYLYSNSRAYDEEQAVDLERLRNWVRHVELRMAGDPDDRDAVPLHASGHATGPELVRFVKQVSPRVLIAIHTEKPDWWHDCLANTGIEVVLPQVGRPVSLGRSLAK